MNLKYFYDYPESQEYSTITNFTYYDVGCKLDNHSDGTGTGRICALLIYLNENLVASLLLKLFASKCCQR